MALAIALSAAPPDPGTISIERALVARAQRGDPRAFRQIFDRHAPGVRRFLGDLLRDDSAADEGTQETFVRAHRALAGLRDDAKLAPWLFGIARNVAHEKARSRRNSRREQPLDEDQDRTASTDASPEQELLRREADDALAAALDTLDESRRAALVLRLDHDLGYPEIAEVMGWNLAKVKNEIHRARLQLRAALSGYLEQ